MKNQTFIRVIDLVIVVALVSTACGINIISPVTKIKTEATKIVDIQVPLPEASSGVELNLDFLAGETSGTFSLPICR
jgi:hypothetical protein